MVFSIVFKATFPKNTPSLARLRQPDQRHALSKGHVKATARGTRDPAVHEVIEGFFPKEPGRVGSHKMGFLWWFNGIYWDFIGSTFW